MARLKSIVQRAIIDGNERNVLHVEERDLYNKDILQAINSLAAHNELFSFFSHEELETLTGFVDQYYKTVQRTDEIKDADTLYMDIFRQKLYKDFHMIF